jgi:hypothetical protein
MSPKERRYELVIADEEVKLVQEVNERIAHGWEPIGGPTAFRSEGNKEVVIQAVIQGKPKSKH